MHFAHSTDASAIARSIKVGYCYSKAVCLSVRLPVTFQDLR